MWFLLSTLNTCQHLTVISVIRYSLQKLLVIRGTDPHSSALGASELLKLLCLADISILINLKHSF